MPARRRKQSNAMLYTLITFIGLLIIATAIAVIYYIEAETYRDKHADLQRERNGLATDSEYQALGSIVGTKLSGKTWLGTMAYYLDGTVTRILGGVPEPTSAEVKIDTAIKKVEEVNKQVENALKLAQEYIDITDPNMIYSKVF